MKLYHVSNSKFDSFDSSFLGTASEDRSVPDEMVEISRFGFCFVSSEEDLDELFREYGDEFGCYVAECEYDGSENFDSTYDDFVNWLEDSGEDEVRECLDNDGIDFLDLYNGNFDEIIPLHMENLTILDWIER